MGTQKQRVNRTAHAKATFKFKANPVALYIKGRNGGYVRKCARKIKQVPIPPGFNADSTFVLVLKDPDALSA